LQHAKRQFCSCDFAILGCHLEGKSLRPPTGFTGVGRRGCSGV